MSDTLYTLMARPELEGPTAVIHLEGWIDAGGGAAAAATHLRAALRDQVVVATFDTDELLDHRARRPVLHLVDGVNTGFTWPELELVTGHVDGHDLLLLTGPEPDHLWKRFTRSVVDLFGQFGVQAVVGLGAYPAAAPHTRPVRLSATATTSDLAAGYLNASLDVPSGAQALIEFETGRLGVDALGIWAQVPHYASAAPFPAAAAALLRRVSSITGVPLDTSDLDADALTTAAALDERIAERAEHAQLLAELERTYDSFQALDGSSGDDLARELEAYLRTQDED